jgi:hypothetical protein
MASLAAKQLVEIRSIHSWCLYGRDGLIARQGGKGPAHTTARDMHDLEVGAVFLLLSN